MKNHLTLFVFAVILASCSSSKYAYHFDHYDYNSGKKQFLSKAEPVESSTEASPLIIEKETLTAGVAEAPAVKEKTSNIEDQKIITEKIFSLTKAERNQLKRDLKAEIKRYNKSKSKNDGASVAAAKAMDHDLKLAAIFGAVGLVLTLFGGVSSVFWVLGVIALVIGVVFLIKWLSRQ